MTSRCNGGVEVASLSICLFVVGEELEVERLEIGLPRNARLRRPGRIIGKVSSRRMEIEVLRLRRAYQAPSRGRSRIIPVALHAVLHHLWILPEIRFSVVSS